MALAIVLMPSCKKDTTVDMRTAVSAVTTTVSFSKDIVPILSSNCALSGCHAVGGRMPTLDANDAFNSLSQGGFISVASPSSSLVYLWLTGKESATMPLGGTPNPSNLNNLMLGWIQQGANNN